MFSSGSGVDGGRPFIQWSQQIQRRLHQWRGCVDAAKPGDADIGNDFDQRARLLDEGLERLVGMWDGEFEPPPVQRPRIPIWVATRWPHRRPLQRAARYDGMFPIEMSGPDDLRVYLEELRDLRAAAGHDGRPYDVVVETPPGDDTAPWEAAGATWVLDAFGSTPREADVRAAIDAGPR